LTTTTIPDNSWPFFYLLHITPNQPRELKAVVKSRLLSPFMSCRVVTNLVTERQTHHAQDAVQNSSSVSKI